MLSYISLAIFCTIVLSYKIGRISYFSFSFVFICLVYVFHLGYLLLTLAGRNELAQVNLGYYVSNRSSTYSSIFSLFSILGIFLGVLIAETFRHELVATARQRVNDIKIFSRFRMVGLFLFAISFPLHFYEIVRKLQYYEAGGYVYTHEAHLNGVFAYLEKPYLFSILLILVSYQGNKRKEFHLLAFGIIIEILLMLSGNRFEPLIYIFTLVYFYYIVHGQERLSYRSVMLLVIFGLLVMVLLVNIKILRASGQSMVSSVGLQDLSTESLLLNIIGELGGTQITLATAFDYIPSVLPYNCGKTYIISLLSIIPAIDSLYKGFVDEVFFVYKWTGSLFHGFGGSVLAEVYYNFGWLGLAVFPVLGFLIQKLYDRTVDVSINARYKEMIIGVLIFSYLLRWVRGYFYTGIFDLFWFSILIRFL